MKVARTPFVSMQRGLPPTPIPLSRAPQLLHNYSENVTVDSKIISLGLWDTIGQEDHDRLRPLVYAQTDVFRICFSLISPLSYENVRTKVCLYCNRSSMISSHVVSGVLRFLIMHHRRSSSWSARSSIYVKTRSPLRSCETSEQSEKSLMHSMLNKSCVARGKAPIQYQQGVKIQRDIGAVKYFECSVLTQKGLNVCFSPWPPAQYSSLARLYLMK
jgi:Ras-related C3 botulinum toxin substrate 1